MVSKPDDERSRPLFESEASAKAPARPPEPKAADVLPPRTTRTPLPPADEAADRPSRITIVNADAPLYEINMGLRGSAAPRDSSSGRRSSPSRPSALPGPGRIARVLAVLLAIGGVLVIGVFLVFLLDTHPGEAGVPLWKPFLDQLSWSAVWDYFFPSNR